MEEPQCWIQTECMALYRFNDIHFVAAFVEYELPVLKINFIVSDNGQASGIYP